MSKKTPEQMREVLQRMKDQAQQLFEQSAKQAAKELKASMPAWDREAAARHARRVNKDKKDDAARRTIALRAAYVVAGRPKREPWCRAHCEDFGFKSWRRAYDLLAGI
jgi:hypothetical protein